MPKTQKFTTGTVDTCLNPAELQAIGHVAAQWSTLELFIGMMIRGLLGVSQRQGHAITSQHNAGNLIHMVRALARESLPNTSAKTRFEKIAKRILVLQKSRNGVVHAVWGRNEDDRAVRMKFTGWGEVKFSKAVFTVADIDKIAVDISRVGGDLYGFMLDFGLIPADGK